MPSSRKVIHIIFSRNEICKRIFIHIWYSSSPGICSVNQAGWKTIVCKRKILHIRKFWAFADIVCMSDFSARWYYGTQCTDVAKDLKSLCLQILQTSYLKLILWIWSAKQVQERWRGWFLISSAGTRRKRNFLKTLTSLNKEVRPFFLGDNSIWRLPSVSSLSDYSTWRSWRLF